MSSKNSHIKNPQEHFAGWVFKIESYQYECVGISYRIFYKNKIPSWAWAPTDPPEYALAQGYIFYESDNPDRYLQIAAPPKDDLIEVHVGTINKPDRTGFVIHISQLIHWLKTGEQPEDSKPIDFAASRAGLMAWQLKGT